MVNKVDSYISAIIKAKWWEDKLKWIPTDIIWFDDFWKLLAKRLEPYVTKKEICYFYVEVKNDTNYHYLEFYDMFEKTELMIFTTELSSDYFDDLSDLNPDVLIVIAKSFDRTIKLLISDWFEKNLLLMD